MPLASRCASISSTEVVLRHTVYTAANVEVVAKGVGFTADALGNFTSGIITSLEFNGLDIRQATVSDIFWNAADFQTALFDAAADSDVSGIVDLFNQSDLITIDASSGLGGFNQEATWAGFLPLITQPIDITGSRFDDELEGGPSDDVITPGSNNDNGDRIVASEGNDRVIFGLADDDQSPGFYLDYDPIADGMTFTIDGVANTASAAGAGFTDVFENVQDALGRYLGIEGTVADDTYDVRLTTDQTFAFIGGRGVDAYTLTADGGRVILDFDFSTTSGIDFDLSTGEIADDGFGNTETFDFTGTVDSMIVLASDEGDRLVDGAGDQLVEFYNGDDLFVADNNGNDSVDGGLGSDTVAFANMTSGASTLTLSGGITTVTDRFDDSGSTALLNVEFIEDADGDVLELAKHDGIGLIASGNLTSLAELYIAYFNRAPDALGLSFWATAFQNGFSLREIADQFFTQPETVALYEGVSDSAFVQAVYNNVFGRDADTAGLDFWTGQLSAGNVTESEFIFEFLAGARAATGDPADVAYIEAKTDIGLYFAVEQGQNNVEDAIDVMDLFDGSQSSITAAVAASDSAFADAIVSDAEMLMPVLGVIDSPFVSVA